MAENTHIPSIEDRVKMALSEVGYSEALVTEKTNRGGTEIWTFVNQVPSAIAWMAKFLAVPGERPCWACYLAAHKEVVKEPARSCARGWCGSPGGPHVPPRDLLLTVGK